jgi:hypothetical protein
MPGVCSFPTGPGVLFSSQFLERWPDGWPIHTAAETVSELDSEGRSPFCEVSVQAAFLRGHPSDPSGWPESTVATVARSPSHSAPSAEAELSSYTEEIGP